jgi:hypothetical protein
MKRNNNYRYSELSSFADLQVERERLKLKSQLAEAKINLNILLISRAFSVTTTLLSFAREFLLPVIGDFLADHKDKSGNEGSPEPAKE